MTPTTFDYLLFWFGSVFLAVCASALFYDLVYKPWKDKIIIFWRKHKLDMYLWLSAHPRLWRWFDDKTRMIITFVLLGVAALLLLYLAFRLVFIGALT